MHYRHMNGARAMVCAAQKVNISVRHCPVRCWQDDGQAVPGMGAFVGARAVCAVVHGPGGAKLLACMQPRNGRWLDADAGAQADEMIAQAPLDASVAVRVAWRCCVTGCCPQRQPCSVDMWRGMPGKAMLRTRMRLLRGRCGGLVPSLRLL